MSSVTELGRCIDLSSTTTARSGVGQGAWRVPLAQQLDVLGFSTPGRFVLEPDPADVLVPAERFFDPDHLREAIVQTVLALQIPKTTRVGRNAIDLRVAASRFSRRYSAFLSATALVGLANGIGLDVSPSRCTVAIRPNGQYRLLYDPGQGEVMRCDERPSPWPVYGDSVATVDELRHYVWRRLYGDQLAPIFALVAEVVPVTPRLLWSSAAEWAALISDDAEENLGAAAPPYVADRVALLDAEALPGVPGPNPLSGKIDWIPVPGGGGDPPSVQTRRHCCITFLLEDRVGQLCDNCPYPPVEDRATLIRLQRDRKDEEPPSAEELRLISRTQALPAVQRALRAARRDNTAPRKREA
jgi:ferric iron reductase protein FhuF